MNEFRLPTPPHPATAIHARDGGHRPLAVLRTLITMPCADVGVGMTCRSILGASAGTGAGVTLFTSRSDSRRREPFDVRQAIPRPLAFLPYRLTRRFYNRRLHDAYLGSFGDGDIAYLWPSVPRRVYEELRARGVPIVAEAINTLMSDARSILDAAYAELGLPPRHRITDERIADEQHRLSLCTAIFSPSPATDRSFARSDFADLGIGASYGTWVPPVCPDRTDRPGDAPVTFLFIGTSPIRKGLHHLLAAWRRAPANARLRIIGLNDPDIHKLFGDVLDQDNVIASGFSPDVVAEYRHADVFIMPSLEEGDPIVTYEAAAHGLPVIASPMGAGRIGADSGAIDIIDTRDTGLLHDRIALFAGSRELRLDWGARARNAVTRYDWPLVAERRLRSLSCLLARKAPDPAPRSPH